MDRAARNTMGMLTVVQKSRGLDAPDPAADFSPAEVCASQDSTDASQHGLNAQSSHAFPGTNMRSWKTWRWLREKGELFQMVHSAVFLALTSVVSVLDKGAQGVKRVFSWLFRKRSRASDNTGTWAPRQDVNNIANVKDVPVAE